MRWLAPSLAGIPVAALYIWQALILPIFLNGYLGDFQESYLRAAQRIASGQDPYDLCATMGCLEPTGPQYVMPPVLAWLLQPLVGVDAHAITVGDVLVLNASLALFVWLMLRALNVRDWQVAALLVLVAIGFEPVIGNVDEGQVNLVLLALSAVWFLAWTRDRWWGGMALGAAIALKLIQGPVALVVRAPGSDDYRLVVEHRLPMPNQLGDRRAGRNAVRRDGGMSCDAGSDELAPLARNAGDASLCGAPSSGERDSSGQPGGGRHHRHCAVAVPSSRCHGDDPGVQSGYRHPDHWVWRRAELVDAVTCAAAESRLSTLVTS